MGEMISREEVLAVYPRVAATIADALACEVERIEIDLPLIDGLDAESIDFLDIVYRLERTFRIKIPRGQIIEEARGSLSEAEFEHKGWLTEAGLARLKQFMVEIAPQRFPARLRVDDVPRLFTAETFCRAVLRAQKRAGV
jgi:acyl carrier protein